MIFLSGVSLSLFFDSITKITYHCFGNNFLIFENKIMSEIF